jgi:hypothetical protein
LRHKRGNKLHVSDVRHDPHQFKFFKESVSIEERLKKYGMGIYQPLILKKGDGR